MISRRKPDTRVVLGLIVLGFLMVMAAWWALRAMRYRASTAPTPVTNIEATPRSQVSPPPRPR